VSTTLQQSPTARGQQRWFFGMLAEVKASSADTGGRYTFVEMTAPAGLQVPLHVHHTEDEGFYVVEGSITVQLGVMTFIVAVGVGIPLGIFAALGHNRWPDYVATTISMVGIATPSFVLAILLIVIFSVGLNWFPARGWKGPNTWVLPVIALAGYQIAQIARYTRASMLEVTRKDYVRTAHSKGVRNSAVVVRHMIRNALIPVVTILGPILAFLVTGSFIIENFFGIPGIGRLYIVAIGGRDYSMIMATTVIYAFAVAFLNFIVDILYAYIDPRIRYS